MEMPEFKITVESSKKKMFAIDLTGLDPVSALSILDIARQSIQREIARAAEIRVLKPCGIVIPRA